MRLFKTMFLATTMAFVATIQTAQAQSCVEYIPDDGETLLVVTNGNSQVVRPFVQYSTVLGSRDLVNSKGTRLPNFLAVLQQDRANVNRFGRPDKTDFGDVDGAVIFVDEGDTYFTTAERRAEFTNIIHVPFCFMDRQDIKSFTNRIMANETGFLFISIFTLPNGKLAVHMSEAG